MSVVDGTISGGTLAPALGITTVWKPRIVNVTLSPLLTVTVPGWRVLNPTPDRSKFPQLTFAVSALWLMAAATVGAIAGAPPAAMTAAVDAFRGLEHAMELVAEREGVRFVNDSKATNVEAARRSIESFDRDLVPIVGGKFKGGDLRLLREPLKIRAKAVVAIGEARPLVREALGDLITVHEANTLADAVARAFELAKPSGVVLLAPACASFDMFRDYADRGRRFKDEVRKLTAAS